MLPGKTGLPGHPVATELPPLGMEEERVSPEEDPVPPEDVLPPEEEEDDELPPPVQATATTHNDIPASQTRMRTPV